MRSHEDLTSFRAVSAGSNRKFGVTVGLIAAVLAVWPLVRHHHPVRWWLLAVALVLVALGLARPALLEPLNRAWFRLGMLLSSVTNPVVMGVMYFAAVVPLGAFLRLRGHDLLRLRRDPGADSYWLPRGRDVEASLKKQF